MSAVEFRAPRGGDVDSVLAMLTRAYVAARADFPADPAVLGAYGRHDTGGGDERWVVLWEGSRPLSALRLFLREITLPGGGTAPIGGIGNVGTDPDAAGRGLATRVMEEAHRRLLESGIGTAVLVTDIPAFYARLGYESVSQRELLGAVGMGGGRSRGGPGTPAEAAPLSAPVPAAVALAHAAAAAGIGGRVVRDETYWSSWILGFHVATSGLDAVTSGGAYAIGRMEDGGSAYRVLEGGGDVLTLSALVLDRMRGASRLKTPDEPLFRDLFAHLRADVSPRARTGIMACSLVSDAPGADLLGGYLELDTF